MNNKTQSSARNRNSVRLQLRFMIIRPPKRAFYPKFAKIVNDFARQLQMSVAQFALVACCCTVAC